MNNKKLFGIVIISLIILIPIVEAQEESSWWDSFIIFIMDLLNIGEEEAKALASDMITPYSKTVELGNNIKQSVFSPQPIYVEEDGEWINKEEAKSLKNKIWNGITLYSCNVESDGINIVECEDFNSTSITLKLKRDDNNLNNIQLRKYKEEENKTTDKIERKYDIKFEKSLDFTSKTEEKILTVDIELDDIIEFGEHSTEVYIRSNDSYGFADGNLYSAAADKNVGQRVSFYMNSDVNIILWFNTSHYIGNNINVLNANIKYYLFSCTNFYGVTFYQQNLHWDEGLGDDPWNDLENSSWNWNNDTTGFNWGGGLNSNGSAVTHMTENAPTAWNVHNITNLTALNENIDAMGGINIVSDKFLAGGDCNMYSSEHASAYFWNITWEADNNAPTIPILNAPPNNSFSADDILTHVLNWSNSTDADGDNIYYYLEIYNETSLTNIMYSNSSINETSNTTGDLILFPNETNDYYWRVLSFDGEINSSWSDVWNFTINVTFSPNRAPTNIQIVPPSPANNTIAINNSYTFNCTAEDLDGDTLYYEVYLDTSNPPTTIFSNETIPQANTTQDGNNWWRCRAVDAKAGASPYSEIRYLQLDNSTIKNITFVTPSPVIETSENTFVSAVTINKLTTTSISGEFIYNNTHYTPTKTTIINNNDIGVFNFSKTVIAPVGSTSVSLNWNFTITLNNGSTVNFPHALTQTVTGVEFKICNSTTHVAAVNFTFFDELTGLEINSSGEWNGTEGNITGNLTSLSATFDFWVGNISAPIITKRYSSANVSSNVSQYQFCIYPQENTITTDMDLEYDAVGYSPRTYYFNNATLDNITNEISLLLLPDSEAVKFFIDVKKGLTAFTYATVTISKYNVGTGAYDVVGVRETDNEGKFVEYLELDKKYKFFIVRSGISYGTIEKQSECATAPCELTLQVQEAVADFWQGYSDIYATSVAYTLDYDDETKMVTYVFNDLTGLAQDFRLEVTEIRMNETGGSICNEFSYATAGTLTCNMTGYDGNFKATGYISRSPEKIVDFILFIISTIKDILGKNGIFIALMLLVVIGLAGAYSPSTGVAMLGFAFLMLWMMGFIAISLTSVILIEIFAIILMFYIKT